MASRNELGSRKVGGDPLESERNLLVALNAHEAIIPVRKPLRCNGGEGGQDQTHQHRRDQRFHQREASRRHAAAFSPHAHLVFLCCKRMVLIFIAAPLGVVTVTTTACGTHWRPGCGLKFSAAKGKTSTRQG